MQLDAHTASHEDATSADYNHTEQTLEQRYVLQQTSEQQADEISFLPMDEARAVTPEDIGMASLETLVSNVHTLFDQDRQDRFFFDEDAA